MTTPTFFDSHAHIDGDAFDDDRDACLARARAAGVREIVVIGATGGLAEAERAVRLAETDPELWATVGIHPHDVGAMEPAWWDALAELARHPRVVGIGETGLDYFYDHSPRELQQTAFARFIAMAQELGKPVVCHIRDAHADARRDPRGGLDRARPHRLRHPLLHRHARGRRGLREDGLPRVVLRHRHLQGREM